jgi:hypothetical protein
MVKHMERVVCAFLSAAVPLNVIMGYYDTGIDVVVDENQLCCRMIPGLARCFFESGRSAVSPDP